MGLATDVRREEAEKARRLALEQRRGDYGWLLRQPQFRRILKVFMAESRAKPFTPDPLNLSYNLGRVALAQELLDALRDADLSLLQQAEREHLEDSHA